jgi:hypothetical protein
MLKDNARTGFFTTYRIVLILRTFFVPGCEPDIAELLRLALVEVVRSPLSVH